MTAVVDQVSEDQEEHADHAERGYAGEGEHHGVDGFAPHDSRVAHAGRPPPRSVATIRMRARPFRMKVIKNKTKPNSIRALRYKSPVASVNSLAMTEAMVYPGANSEALIWGLLPMTIVTAMVSPSARARARKTEPMMPVRAQGTTTCQVDSQRVAPMASAASRCSRGTLSKTSRDTEIMKGTTMMARTMPAVRNPTP